MIARFHLVRAFVIKEILQVLRDRRMRIVLFIAPLLQLTIFGVAISNETRNIRIAYWAKESDQGIKDFYQRVLGTQWFIPAQTQGEDPFNWVQSGQADVVLVGGAQELLLKNQESAGKIQLLINAQNSGRAYSIESYLQAISNQIFQPPGGAARGLQFEIRALYNPSFETSVFMVPGVLSMLVCLVTILLTSMSVAREKEMGTIETLTAAPLGSLDLLLGKTIPFVILGCLQAPLILTFAVAVFHLPVRGPIFMLALATLLMVLATVSIGILISTLSRNQQQAMLGGFMYLFPSYLLSGLMFPIENMPFYFQPLAYINPLTHYMALLRNILLMGGDHSYFFIHSFVLLCITVFLGILAHKRFRALLV